ncbi:MAG: NUDIX domain-containing protein [Myxococcaceae bacterium]
MASEFKFCPRCGAPLVTKEHHGRSRALCEKEGCGFVHWGNPVPVVAAIIEHEGQVLLARGKNWPEKMFALVTGFLEAGESPEAGVLREVKEEVGLDGEVVSLVGVHEFEMKNELIIAFHVRTRGEIKLGDELAAYKLLPKDKVRTWPMGTGIALEAWLKKELAR